MTSKEPELFYPESRKQWRKWLIENHEKKDSVWLIQYIKKSGKPSISWSEAVEEALCFGWIDSVKKKLDPERTIQFFSKRKDKSTWSKINKDKVERLITSDLMAPAGLEKIRVARANGSWDILNSVEGLVVPKELEIALQSRPAAMDNFTKLSKSKKKMVLYRIQFAKRQETKDKRIKEIVDHLEKDTLPLQF